MTGVLLALLLVAGTATAQRGVGGMGGMGGRRGGGMGGAGGRQGGGMQRMGAREQSMKFPSAKTLEKYNPASLLLDKHRKLSLADSQEQRLKELRQQIFERNAGILGRYDSLQKDFRPPRLDPRNRDAGSPAADSTRRAAAMQMRQLRMLADSLQERRRRDVRDVIGVLTDDTQRMKAADFLDEQDFKFSDEFPAAPMQRVDRGDGGLGGGGRGGRRPPDLR